MTNSENASIERVQAPSRNRSLDRGAGVPQRPDELADRYDAVLLVRERRQRIVLAFSLALT